MFFFKSETEALVDDVDVKQLELIQRSDDWCQQKEDLVYGEEYLVPFFRMWRRETG